MTHRLRADSPHFLKQPLFRHYVLSFNELESGGSRPWASYTRSWSQLVALREFAIKNQVA